jgi:hypothetical protein
VLGDAQRVRADVRRAARSARTNAQTSLDRLRNEPRRDVAAAEGVFANANRFIRAAMALEATRQHAGPNPQLPAITAFAQHADHDLSSIVRALNGEVAAPPSTMSLRSEQETLRKILEAASHSDLDVQTAAWIDASDRITDSIDTLSHMLRGERKHEGT